MTTSDVGGRIFVVNSNVQHVYARVASESWKYTDKAGHEHRYVEDVDHYPTLEKVVTPEHWCEDCNDTHNDGEYLVCKVCRERIRPGTRDGVFLYNHGTTYMIDGQPVPQEEFEAALKAAYVEQERDDGQVG